jgi:hypothetical protein
MLYVAANLIEARGMIVHHDDLTMPEIEETALARVPAVRVRITMQLDMLDL